MQSHFELFGLPPAFSLDREALERSYRSIQAEVHPDRFAGASEADRRASLQRTTQVNDAYRTLKDPVQRAKHLLDLQGVDVGFETNTAMPREFLLQQLEFRESLDDAEATKDAAALDSLRDVLRKQKRDLEGAIAQSIDVRKDYAAAAGLVRKLMFLDRLDAEVDEAYAAVEEG